MTEINDTGDRTVCKTELTPEMIEAGVSVLCASGSIFENDAEIVSNIFRAMMKVSLAYAKIAEVEAVAARFPGDRSILANLKSLKRDAASLEEAWQQASLRAQKEVCRYRFIPRDNTSEAAHESCNGCGHH